MTERKTPPAQRGGHSPRAQHEHVYTAIAAEPDFAELRRRYRRFAFPATIAFMVWYVTYVAFNNWARDFMNTPVIGNINVAVVFGLLQFLSTFAIAFFYARHANRVLDPLATRLRERYETETDR
ncbi:MAG: hypothetical protein AVDCRST_MAG61-936 [uncultured Friedmanniella sp.]|uniref:DUF485 domain-containing protein n=1 Tax=uncultured Friedmanniella sp. TaxID=335381 RepID=A0A6J4K9I7_9ACTN|nr:DUF485 domain-containing protein [uncultured Friedmanniella sp.]CAA9298442.1 MAG: hypothetical protein AVDCRST_MAG61-936 [uncultured Friedmanniella sp.]